MIKNSSKNIKQLAKYQLYVKSTSTVLEEVEHPDRSIALEQIRAIGKKKYWNQDSRGLRETPIWGHDVSIRRIQ